MRLLTDPTPDRRTPRQPAWRILLLALLVTVLLPGALRVAAQGLTPSLTITGIDTSQFPEVRATIHGEGLEGGLAGAALTLLEDGAAIQATSDQTTTAGVQVMVVLDAWEGINENGLTDKPQKQEVIEAVDALTRQFLQPETDYLAFTSYNNAGERAVPEVIAGWTRDGGGIVNALGDYDTSTARSKTPLHDLLFAAIAAFDDPSPGAGKVRHLVVFSDGYDDMAVADKNDLLRQAEERQVRIDTVQIGSENEALRRNLENLSLNTGGSFERLTADNALLPNLWGQIGADREQRLLGYRSTKAQPGELTVRATAGTGQLEASADFPSNLVQPPAVTILEPAEATVTRALADGSPAPAETPRGELEPRSIRIQAEVTWPDGRQRRLRNVEYVVGDKTMLQAEGEMTSIDFPIDDLPPGPYTIRVRATDELGLTSAEAVQELQIAENVLPTKVPPEVTIVAPPPDPLDRTAAPGQRLRFDTPPEELVPETVTIAVDLRWPDEQPRALQSVEYKIADRTVVQSTEPFTQTAFPIDDLDQGDYTISVRATDVDGRTGTYVTQPLKIVVNRPPTPKPGTIAMLQPATATITRTLAGGAQPAADTPLASLLPNTVDVAFDISWPDGQERQLQRVEYQIGDKTVVRTEEPLTSVAFPIESFDRNDYTVRIRALDEFGITTEHLQPLRIWINWPAPLPAWLTYAAMALAVAAVLFAGYMWYNPRFRRRVTEVAVNATTRVTRAVTAIFSGAGAGGAAAAARLIRVTDNASLPETIELTGGITKLGRSATTATVAIRDDYVSGVHCQIAESNGIFYISDANSQNGTYVNGRRVDSGRNTLTSGDEITLGRIKYRFESRSTPRTEPASPGATGPTGSTSPNPTNPETGPTEHDGPNAGKGAGGTQPDTQHGNAPAPGAGQQPGARATTSPASDIYGTSTEDSDATVMVPRKDVKKDQSENPKT